MKQFNTKFKKAKLAMSISAALVLSACGGTGQDDGVANDTTIVASGLAIDGYLARSTVFIDSNNDGTRNPWEAWAFTDNQGYFSYNPTTDTDYCAENATPQQQQYCLVSNVEYDNVVIRVDGGYDVLTGEPFLGQLSRRINAQVSEEITNTVISPLTSLLSNIDDNTQIENLLNTLEIQSSDLEVDYLNDNGGVNVPLLNTALKVHKVVALLSDRLTDTYTEIGEDFGTPNDASSLVYPSLARQLINVQQSTKGDLDSGLSDELVLISVLDEAELALRDIYERKEFDLPSNIGSISNPAQFQSVLNVASNVGKIANKLIDPIMDLNLDDATAGSRALEALIIKAIDDNADSGNQEGNDIENMIKFLNIPNSSQQHFLVTRLLANLQFDDVDIRGLAVNSFDDFNIINSISRLPEEAKPLSNIVGKTLKISVLDLKEEKPYDRQDKEYEFYFSGSDGDMEGAFTACFKHIDGASYDSSGELKLGDGNSRGELIKGFWSLLGADSADEGSFSLLITLDFLGATYQGILKPAGIDPQNGYNKIRFDNAGDLLSAHSVEGLVASSIIPSTNAECQERLPSRL